MSFPTFVSCIKDGLFVPTPLLFNDRWEGLMPFHTLDSHELALDRHDYRRFAEWTYVSCWHDQPHESFPMWKIYGRAREAVMIQTTSEKLARAFQAEYPNTLTYLDHVSYRNPLGAGKISLPNTAPLCKQPADVPGGEWYPYMLFMFVKHITYEYEREVRLVTLDADYIADRSNPKKGITLHFRSMPDFIDHVTVAPGVDEWFYETVKETAARFGVRCEVSRSSLEVPPGA